ncbi:MAG: ribonuclease PH [Trueperaceae bacterium]|nr:ribonuclease PH [Trueperaceae bacterium]
MREGRSATQLRPIALEVGVNRWAEGSARVTWGDTQVQATVSVEARLPPHLRGGKARGGWLTAEYALLPRATGERRPRERLYAGGRSLEIQRLIGRALRTAVDLDAFPKKTLTVDVDVLQADGGTRCAGILAGYAALRQLADRMIRDGELSEWPLRTDVAAISVGLVEGEARTDLDYQEDDAASLDLNVVATRDGRIVEVQGGAEGEAIDAETYVGLIGRGVRGVADVLAAVQGSLP